MILPFCSGAWRRLLEDACGAVAVEVALATPFLVLLTAGVIEYGKMLSDTQLMQTGVRDAARYLASIPGLPTGAAPNRSLIEEQARRLAVTGTVASGASARIKDWDVTASAVQIAYLPSANGRNAVTGLRSYRGDDAVYVVRVTGSMPYTGIGLLQALHLGSFSLRASHEERHVAP
jgi:Flp pilus assembly protein TadG